MRAEYKQNLGQIKIRLQAEEASVEAFEQAQQNLPFLLETANGSNSKQTMSQLQRIINQLQRVKPGTTVYSNAQVDLMRAQNKLNQFNP
jgi:multidrug resistance efflux pump